MIISARLLTILFLVPTLLGACTMAKPLGYNLPDSDSIVAGGTYTVGRNENIYAIAQKQGVKMRDIIALNNLKPPFALRTGQTLTLPNKDKFAAPAPEAAPLDYIDKGAMAPSQDGLAGTVGVSAVPLDAPPAAPPPPMAVASSSSGGALPSATNYVGTPAKAAETLPPIETKTEAMPAASDQNAVSVLPQPPTATQEPEKPVESPTLTGKTPTFGWPVRGTIISAFGPKGKGLDNDGINIAAPKGSPVKAAESGIVAYSGNEMKGFGNLVLIRHEGGWVSAYAHLDRLVVARDTVVAKGDMIGTVGTSGGVSSPQLHFEARQEGKPVDPELVIK